MKIRSQSREERIKEKRPEFRSKRVNVLFQSVLYQCQNYKGKTKKSQFFSLLLLFFKRKKIMPICHGVVRAGRTGRNLKFLTKPSSTQCLLNGRNRGPAEIAPCQEPALTFADRRGWPRRMSEQQTAVQDTGVSHTPSLDVLLFR